MPKGKRISSAVKKVICNVYEYFEKESRKHKGSVYPKFGKKTADATGYCKGTVERVVGEKRNLDGKAFTSPAKRYKKSRIQIVIDDFDCDAIRRSVHDVYAKKEYPTIEKLLHILKEKELFAGGRTTLWKLLKKTSK